MKTSAPTRRDFIKSVAPGVAALLAGPSVASGAVEAFGRLGDAPGGLRLGLAAYSFRNYFRHQRGGKTPEFPEEQWIEMKDFITFCAQHQCGGAEVTGYFFPEDVTNDYLLDVRRHALLNGIELSGTAIGNNFSHPEGAERNEQMTYTKEWIDRAALMGAPHIRVFAGKHPKGVSEEDAEKFATEALEEAGDYAGQKGVFLGIENHDSIGDAGRLLRIVRAVKSPWVGVNLDTGNFRTEDPYKDIEECAPYALNVQVKMEMRSIKQPADLERIGKILKDTGYRGYVVLEYEENDNPYEAIPPILERMRKFCDW